MKGAIDIMSIEMYVTGVIYLYIGLFLLAVVMGIAAIWRKIRRKTLKCWWLIPCSMLYLIFTISITFTAYIAYDDPADPNYSTYKDWGLREFILNDIKMLAIWAFIGALLYLVFEGKKCNKSIRVGCSALLIFLAVLFVVLIMLSFTKVS